ncbi:MAG TPA: hypothetical protein VIC55_10075 [Gemmatimonadaceae bacterium]|jgi:hypothetical protein
MTIETRERFLRAIAERLSAGRVEEVHLFPVLRQGGTESAVAVIAVRRAPPEAPVDGADAPPPPPGPAEPAAGPERLTVYRATYRLVLKGPERGTWDVGVIEEADAPRLTVGRVVRGVHERSGGGDDEPERLGGDAFRAAVSDEPWTAVR